MTNICRCGHVSTNPRGRAYGRRHGEEGLRNDHEKDRKAANLSRRKFIVGSAAAGGGLALGFYAAIRRGDAEAATPEPK